MKKSVVSCLLAAVLALLPVAPLAAQSQPTLSAVTIVNQLPTTCSPTATPPANQVVLQSNGGAFQGQPSGLYNCVAVNVWQLFGQGANTLEVLGADSATITTVATTVLSFPINPFGVYKYSCSIFWTNSGTNAETFTITTPTSPNNVFGWGRYVYAAAGTQNVAAFSGSPLTSASTSSVTGTGTNEATILGTIENGATGGTLAFQISAASGNTVVKRGSFCSLN